MANNQLNLGITAGVTGGDQVDKLDASLNRVAATSDRVSKSAHESVDKFQGYAKSVEKSGEALLALAGAHGIAATAIERYSVQAVPRAVTATDALVDSWRALRLAISPTLFTAASIGVGILVEETLRLVNARGKLIEQQSLLAASSGNSFLDIEKVGSASRLSGGNPADVVAALTKLRETISSKKAQSALGVLGIQDYQKAAATPELLAEIAKGFSSIEDPVKRAQAAVDLFGVDLAGKVLPQLNQRFAEASQATRDWALTLSEADRNNIYVFRRDVENLKESVLSLGVGFAAAWHKIGQSVAVEGAEIYKNIRLLASQIDEFQSEYAKKNGEVPYVSLLVQDLDLFGAKTEKEAGREFAALSPEAKSKRIASIGLADVDRASRLGLGGRTSAADAAVQFGVAGGLAGDAAGAIARRASTKEGVQEAISRQKAIMQEAQKVLSAEDSTDSQRSLAASSFLGASGREQSAQALLKVIQEQEKIASKLEAHYISIVEQIQQLRANGEAFLQIGDARSPLSVIATQGDRDAARGRRPPGSLYRKGDYIPGGGAAGDLPGGPIGLGDTFVSPSSDRREAGFNGIAGGGLFDDPKFKQAEQIKLDGARNLLDYTTQIVQLRTGPGGELEAALKINSLRLDAAEKEFETTNDIVALENTRTKLAYERATLAEQESARDKQKVRDVAGGLFDSLFGGGAGVSHFIQDQLKSVARTVVENGAGLGTKAITGLIPHASDPNSTIGKLLQGTPFAANPLKSSMDRLTAAVDANTAALSVGGVGGGGIPSGLGGLGGVFGGGASNTNPFIFNNQTGGFSINPNAVGGLPNTGAIDGIAVSSNPGAFATAGAGSGFGFNAKTVAGIGAAVGGGIAAYSDFKSGGAKNAVAGVGSALGAAAGVAALTDVGAPVALALGIAAAVTSLAAGFLPDPKKAREYTIQHDEIDRNRYHAPTALNISQDSAGNFTDFDGRGNLRQSPFRAVPSVSQAYTWWKGNTPTEVAGGVTSPFQQAPVIQHIYQAGAIQTMDAGSFHEFAQKNAHIVADAAATGLQNSHQRLTSEIQYAVR